MKKPKISPTELSKLIALFDVDERVESFQGTPSFIAEMTPFRPVDFSEASLSEASHSYFKRRYAMKEFVVPGPLVDKSDLTIIETWVEC